MRQRLWTLDEANQALPQVRQDLLVARGMREQLRQAQETVEDLQIVHGEAVQDPACKDHAEYQEATRRMQQHKQDLVELGRRLHKDGIELKDIDAGLVDFWAEIGPERVFLCWREGEETITHWHSLTGGFAGRQEIPMVPDT